jgi:trehalose-6-phosphatase
LKLQNASFKDLYFFLDFDGSLCPHLEVWEGRPYDPQEIYEVVAALSKKAGGVYWNTGRRVESLGSVLSDYLLFSGYFIQGSLRWDASTKTSTLVGPSLPQDLVQIYQKALEGNNGLRLEVKPSSLRIAPYQNVNMAELHKFILLHPLPLGLKGWIWHVGARGAELLSTEYNKSFAIRDVEAGLAPGRAFKPVVIGDDLLDRPAVEEALKREGYAILVGEHCGWATEIEHKAWQVEFFNDSHQALQFLKELSQK